MLEGVTRPERAAEIIEQIVDDELVIYNLTNDDVHLLNATTAAVWRLCDGTHTVDAIAAATGFDTDIVWIALRELDRSHLLLESIDDRGNRISRRQLMRRVAIGAIALPVVTSIVAPTAAAAASNCTPDGAGCAADAECCGGSTCDGGFCTPPGVGCVVDAQCGPNQLCRNGTCIQCIACE